MGMKLAKRTVFAALAAGAVLTTIPLAAQSASAAPVVKSKGAGLSPNNAACGKAGTNKDTGGARHTAKANSRIRTGSSTSCTAVGEAQTNHSLDYYCYTDGSDGLTWTYLHDSTINRSGWIRDDLLTDGGSFSYCGF